MDQYSFYHPKKCKNSIVQNPKIINEMCVYYLKKILKFDAQSSIIDALHTKNKKTRKSLRKKSDVAIPQTNCSLFESSQDISIRQEKRCFSIEAPIWQKLQMASAIPISRDWIVFSKKEVTTVVLVFWQSYYIKDSLSIEKNVLAFPTILKNTRHYRDQ